METSVKQKLQEREAELIKIVQAIDSVLRTEDWKILEELVWNKRVESLDRQILTAAKLKDVDVLELKYLTGRRDEANRYDLEEYGKSLVKELETLKINKNK